MQVLTQAQIDAIKSTDQSISLRLEVYDSNRSTLLATIAEGVSFSVSIARKRKVRRTLDITIANPDGAYTPDPRTPNDNLFWPEIRWLRLYANVNNTGEILLGEFNIDTVTPEKGILRITARDGAKRVSAAKIDTVTTYADSSAAESTNYASTAIVTATSNIQAGDQIQRQAAIQVTAYATVQGIRQKVGNDLAESSTNRPENCIDGSTVTQYQFRYSAPFATKLELEVLLDMRTIEPIQSIAANLISGTVVSTQKSTDGNTWTNFVDGDTARFLKLTIEQTSYTTANGANILTIAINELQILAGSSYPASNAVDSSENTYWKPALTDINRQITIDLGQDRVVNTVILKWGLSDQDKWNRVKYMLEYATSSAPSSFTLWADQQTSVSGLQEHPLTASVTVRYIRITITGVTGIAALRHVKVVNITGSSADGRPNTTISRLITSIAQAAGETKLRVKETNQFLPSYTLEENADPMDEIIKLAESIGWIAGYSYDGYLEAGPEIIDPTNPCFEYIYGQDNILDFVPEYSGADVYNSIKLVGGNTGTQSAIVATASYTSPLSPTGIPRIGKKFIKVEDELANTQEKANERVKELLWDYTQVPVPASFKNSANPAHDAGDVIRVKFDLTKTDAVFLVNEVSFSGNAENGEFTASFNISQIAR